MIDTTSFRVSRGAPVDLAAVDTRSTAPFTGDKAAAKEETKALNERLEELQELLYAQGRHKVLVVLQATDTGGKDGTIRRVFEHVNPQGVKVASFKRPTDRELAHDYLWRVHAHTPGAGEIALFNRSHYEDVLVVRVHGLVPEERWRARYRHIRDWEQMLADEGTVIVKFFLHISADEQRERLQARLDRPDNHWKFDKGDLEEREHWDDYQAAFTEAIAETSTDDAPWYVVPADRKWFRDLVITQVMVETLEGLDMTYPPPKTGSRT